MTNPQLPLAEAIERLDSMPGYLDAAMAQVGADALGRRPEAGKFSLREHACHLRDLEREGFLVRVRRLVSEQSPRLEPFDGGAVAVARDYPSQDARIAAREFAAARRELTGMLAPLTADMMEAHAFFGDQPVTFGELVSMMVGHDREHREDIDQLLAHLARQGA
ncbi:MAG: DinB family protein [Usitatibacter sp.]